MQNNIIIKKIYEKKNYFKFQANKETYFCTSFLQIKKLKFWYYEK